MHPLPARRADGDDAGVGHSLVPPIVETVDAHRLLREAAHTRPWDRLLLAHQEAIWLDLDLKNVTLEVKPEGGLGMGSCQTFCPLVNRSGAGAGGRNA